MKSQEHDIPDSEGKWITESSRISPDCITYLLYRNKTINRFTDSAESWFVAANKGMGKTLILTEKRRRLSDKSSDAIFIPADRPFLDLSLSLPSSVRNGNGRLALATHENAKMLWSLSLQITVIANLGIDRSLFEGYSLDPLLSDWLDRPRKLRPSQVFEDILSDKPGSLAVKQLAKYESIVRTAYLSVKRSVFIFIDKLDQSAEGLDFGCWKNIQTGLLEAVFELNQANSHVRTFISIRQEAWEQFESQNAENIEDYLIELQYEEKELKLIMDSLAKFYDRVDTIEESVGIQTLHNDNSFTEEKIFRYMLRHTAGRPRDLVLLMREIYKQNAVGNPEAVKQAINHASENKIVKHLINEHRNALHVFSDDDMTVRFFSRLHSNIITREQMIQDFCSFNGIPTEADVKSLPDAVHPYHELYQIGLLGYLEKAPGVRKHTQRFKFPSDAVGQESLKAPPYSTHYFIHPCLISKIEQISNGAYVVYRGIVVGHGYDWGDTEAALFSIQELARVNFPEDLRANFERALTSCLKRRAEAGTAELNIESCPEYASVQIALSKLTEQTRRTFNFYLISLKLKPA